MDRFQSLFLVTLSVFLCPGYSQARCKEASPVGAISDLSCEMRRNEACEDFFKQVPTDFRRDFGLTCPESDEGSLYRTTSLCGGLTVAAGLSAWQTINQETREQIAKKAPGLLQKFGTKLLPYISVLGTVTTLYSVTEILNESIQKDRECFKDVEKKKATVAFLAATSTHLLDRTRGLLDEIQTKQLRLPAEYQRAEFIEKVTCQHLGEIISQQKHKQDEVLGLLIAKGKLRSDPRKEFLLSDEEKRQTAFLMQNLSCLAPQRRVELLCAVGNAVMGGVWLKGVLGNMSARPTARLHLRAGPLSSSQKEVIRKIEAQAEKMEIALAGCGYSLTSNICRGASGTLKDLLETQGIVAKPMRNRFHTFLRVDDFYGPGRHLIVDPTYRQFIRGTYSADDPKIFIGSERDLLDLLKKRKAVDFSDYFENLVPDPGVPSVL